MAGEVVVDTSVLVAHLRKDAVVTSKLRETDVFFVPLTVIGELHFGACRSADVGRARDRLRTLLSVAAVLYPDDDTAYAYGEIKGDLADRGVRIPDNDIWIAASAVQYGLPLAARDEHFERVKNLNLLSW